MTETAPVYQTDSHIRSLLKASTWRVTATMTTITIAYFLTGDVKMALEIGAWEFVIKMFVYYGHERLWQIVPRGTIRELAHRKK